MSDEDCGWYDKAKVCPHQDDPTFCEKCGKPAKERPIIFSAPMVLALLAGRKTQTRRAVKGRMLQVVEERMAGIPFEAVVCPYGVPGDRLWVRETWAPHPRADRRVYFAADKTSWLRVGDSERGGYRWDFPERICHETPPPDRYKSSLFMPRWASRIDLELTDVRIQRLHDITEADALAEGCLPHGNLGALSARERYALLWGEINGAGSWDANPWCWALSFKRLRP